MVVTPPRFDANEIQITTKLNLLSDAIRDAQNPPACVVRRDAAQSISNSAFNDVQFDTEAFDNANMWSSAANTAINLPDSAVYIGLAWAQFDSNATGIRILEMDLDGNRLVDQSPVTTTSAASTRVITGAIFAATAGSVVTLRCWQNSGGALNVVARIGVARLSGPLSIFTVF